MAEVASMPTPSESANQTNEAERAAEARKRRKAIMQESSSSATYTDGTEHPSSETTEETTIDNTQRPSAAAAPPAEKKRKKAAGSAAVGAAAAAAKPKKKTQIRYDPEVPMSKEQLAAWRREARRVRNRESAAASRQRIRNRITELECELEDWKSKYGRAMERLEELEQIADNQQQGGPAASAVNQQQKLAPSEPFGDDDNKPPAEDKKLTPQNSTGNGATSGSQHFS